MAGWFIAGETRVAYRSGGERPLAFSASNYTEH
jgi:hypothetical protein